MAADATLANLTVIDATPLGGLDGNMVVRTNLFDPFGLPWGVTTIDTSPMSSGGSSGPPPRPSSGFLYPRGDC